MVDLHDVLQRCIELVPSKGITLHTNLQILPKSKGVYRDLQMVFTNLMSNTITAMPNGGNISIESKVVDNQIIIAFADTGVGIAPDMKEKIWQPYISGNQSESGNDTGGRGWGLTIVHRIIDEHHGFISCDSELGKGTTFTISIPIKSI